MATPRPELRVVPDRSLAEALRGKRLQDRLTQAELARQWFDGVQQQTIANWERGGRPQGHQLPRLAAYLGVTVAEVEAMLDTRTQTDLTRPRPRVADSARRFDPDDAARSAVAGLIRAFTVRVEQGERLSSDEATLLTAAVQSLNAPRATSTTP